jgi:hypothetical protein
LDADELATEARFQLRRNASAMRKSIMWHLISLDGLFDEYRLGGANRRKVTLVDAKPTSSGLVVLRNDTRS